MKNGIHLEDAEFFKLKPNYLKSVKKVGLGKQFQVSGYFYVEQSSFLWMVHHIWEEFLNKTSGGQSVWEICKKLLTLINVID